MFCTHLKYAPFPDGTAAVFLLQANLPLLTALILTQVPLYSLLAALLVVIDHVLLL